MNIKDFDLLTQEDIDEVIAEVLEEASPSTIQRTEAVGDEFNTAPGRPGRNLSDRLRSMVDKYEDSEDEDETEATVGDISPDPAAGYNAKTGGNKKTQAAGAGLGSALSNAAQQGNIAKVGQGKLDKKPSMASKIAGGIGKLKDKFTGKPQMGDPDADQDDGIKDIDPESGEVGPLGSAWFMPGSSNLPKAALARINSEYPDNARMTPTQVVTAYVRAGHGSDLTSLMAKEEYKMTLSRLGRYVKKAQQSGDENDAMKVRLSLIHI